MDPFMCIQIVTKASLFLYSIVLYCASFLFIFKIFNSFFSKIQYRTKAVVWQNIFKVTVQHAGLNSIQYFLF